MIPTRFNRLGLPPFRRVAYLESTGTQYIDTGVAPDFAGGDSIRVVFDKYVDSNSVCLFGSREPPAVNGVYALGGNFVYCDNVGYYSVPISGSGHFVMTVDDNSIQFGDETYIMYRRVTCAYPIYIFALNNGGAVSSKIDGMRLYDWKYYRSGTLAQHLVPVLDKSGVPCLFDEVTRTFKYNAGTGVFNYA